MTQNEHLLTILAEECAEIAQRVSKCLRFGCNEVQPGQSLDNVGRLVEELNDLMAVILLLKTAKVVPTDWLNSSAMAKKLDKVAHFLTYSIKCGTLDEPESHCKA